MIEGRPEFFGVTKKMHNALQGAEINLTDQKRQVYEEVVYESAVRMHLDHDVVIVHDPQPLPIIRHYRKKSPGIWRCHVDPGSSLPLSVVAGGSGKPRLHMNGSAC